MEEAVSLAMTGTIPKETAVQAAHKPARVPVAKLKVISTKVLTARTPSTDTHTTDLRCDCVMRDV